MHGVEFRNIGPAGMSGRVTAIDVDSRNHDHIFIGAASGGVWMSDDGGIDWVPVFDDADVQSIGSIKIDPSNSDVIYAGTGEGNPRNSHTSGKGLYKSIDGGKNWDCIGLEETKLIHRIIVNPQNPDIVYAGTLGSAWGPNEERGLYRSLDGGDSWSKILYINDSTGIADVVMDPHNPNKLIAATWQFGRTPWTFNSGGPGSGLYLTWDGGDNWKEITSKDGLPKGDLGRIGIAIAHGKSNIVYALVEAKENGLYKSMDGGRKWSLVSKKNIGGRPFYYAELYVDPSNENRLFNLHTYMSMSEDGGRTFRNVLDYGKGVHPDHHAFWISPADPTFMLDGNDGGLAISRDGGRNWRYVTNLPLGQFYHVSIDEQVPFNVYGGLQDNGSWYGPSTVYKRGGIRNHDWREMNFGDGFDVVPLGDGSEFMYAMSQGGNVSLISKKTGKQQFIKPVHPDNVPLRFNWNAAIAVDPFSPDGIYFGSQFVHYSPDRGKNWKILSPDLTTNDTTMQKQSLSGGLTRDATAAENHTTILCIAPDPFDDQVIWAGTDDGHLQITRNGGESWEEISGRLPGFPSGGWFSQVRHSAINQNEVFVVVNDYRRNNWSSYAYKTTDNGVTWQRIVDDNDVKGHCHSIIQDVKNENLLFLGTEMGLYYSFDGGNQWSRWKKKFPAVPVRDLQISKSEGSLVVGTFGRSIWVLDDLTPLRFISEGSLDSFNLIYQQPAYQANIKAADGIRFTADGEYEGTNRRYGLNYYVCIPEQKNDTTASKRDTLNTPADSTDHSSGKKAEKPDPEKMTMYIVNTGGDTIVQKTFDVKPGINALRWNMRRQGARGPSRNARKKDNLPSRWDVEPGKYRLHCNYMDQSESVDVVVRPDPREGSTTSWDVVRDYQAKYDTLLNRLGQGTDELVKFRDELKLAGNLVKNLPDSSKKEWKKNIKSLNKSIDSLFVDLLGDNKVKGIDAVTPNIYNDVRRSAAYIDIDEEGEYSNLENSMSFAREKSNDWLESLNQFVDNSWKPFVESFKNLNLTPFSDHKQIEKIDGD